MLHHRFKAPSSPYRAPCKVALDWTEDQWRLAWMDPRTQKRCHRSWPMAGLGWIQSPKANLDAWVKALRSHLHEVGLEGCALSMALPAGVVQHEWVWSDPDLDVSRLEVLASEMPVHWVQQGIQLHGPMLERHAIDVKAMPAPGGPASMGDESNAQRRYWWVLAEAWVVRAHRRLIHQAGASLSRLDVRAAVLVHALQSQEAFDGSALVVDVHYGQTQWLVVGDGCLEAFGSFSHQRLAEAEHLDYLLSQLSSLSSSHSMQSLWLSGERLAFAEQVAQSLALPITLWSRDGRGIDGPMVVVDGLLDQATGVDP